MIAAGRVWDYSITVPLRQALGSLRYCLRLGWLDEGV